MQQTLLVYGYFQPQPDELAWLNTVTGPDSLLFLPTGGSPFFADTQAAIAWLQRQGWEVVPDGDTPEPSPTAQLCHHFLTAEPPKKAIETAITHAYGTFEAEIRSTLAQVKELLNEDVPGKEIAIIARDERAYGPKLIDIAWEYGVPIRALYGTPLLTTRLGG